MIPNDPISQEIFASPSYPYFENEPPVQQSQKKTKSPDLFSFDPTQSQKGKHNISKLPAKQLENLDKEKQAIENLVSFASSLRTDQVKNIQDRVNEISDGLIGRIVNDLHIENKLEAIIIEGMFTEKSPILEGVLVGVNMANRGLVVFAAGVLLAKVKETLAAKEASLPNLTNEDEKQKLEKEILVLKKWVDLQSEVFSDLVKDIFINSIFSLPKAGSAIMTLAQATEVATTVAEFTFLGIGVISCAFSLHSADSNLDKHELWVGAMKNSGNTRQQVKNILNKHLALRDENEPERKKLVDSIVTELKKSDPTGEILKQSLKQLKSAGITIPEEIWTENPLDHAENLMSYLENPGNAARLNQMMISEKQTLSVSTRNALKTLNNKKNEVNRGFLNFDLFKSVTVFSVTAVITTLTVIIQVLALVGVAAATFAVVGTVLGYGMLALVFGFMLFGSIYFYVKRPNVFKTYLNGVQSQLFFWKIPLAIQNYRKNYMLMEEIQISHNINELANRVLELNKISDKPEDQLSYFNSHIKDIKKVLSSTTLDGMATYTKHFKTKKVFTYTDIKNILSAYKRELGNQEKAKISEVESYVVKLKELGESIHYFEQQIQPLQDQINEAGLKDFLHNLHSKRPKKEKEESIEENAIPLQVINAEAVQDEIEIIAENLVKEAASSIDSETQKLLHHMDIDFKISSRKAKKATKSISKQLRVFFSMGPEETLSMIGKLNQKNG